MRIVSLLSWTAILLGCVGIAAGGAFHVPKGTYLGVFLIGAGFALAGLESLCTRRMSLRSFGDTSEAYAGAPAVIWGLMATIIGIAFIGAAYAMHAGAWRATVDRLAAHPGPAFVAIGALLAGAGALLMVRGNDAGALWRALLVRYPRLVIGLAIVLTGLLLAGTGAWETVHPRGFERHLRSREGAYARVVCDTWKHLLRGQLGMRAR
ncbi:MAG TPA: hypothetical protein VNT02_16470 [Burkholderiales bacterium]|nr:hypothetical protein [Burkholderiales bacterium]